MNLLFNSYTNCDNEKLRHTKEYIKEPKLSRGTSNSIDTLPNHAVELKKNHDVSKGFV